jgi:hypothetical protein
MILYVNGCSFTSSVSKNHPKKEEQNKISWCQQLNNQFSDIVNDAISCSSNFRIVRNTINYIKNNYHKKDDIFVWVCWSGTNRFEIFTNDDVEIEYLKNLKWAAKEYKYDGLNFNMGPFFLKSPIVKNNKVSIIDEKNNIKEIKTKAPAFYDNYNYHINNANFIKYYDDFVQQILLLQSFLKTHNIKYGMSFAFRFNCFELLTNETLIDKNTFFDFNNDMCSLVEQNGFKRDETFHFYPDGYEFYGQQIAKFIKENYNL